jgi:hypothetical protein
MKSDPRSPAFVNGKLLAKGEVLQDDRLMTFSKEPNQLATRKIPAAILGAAFKQIGTGRPP